MWIAPALVASAFAMPLGDLDWRVVNDTVMGGVSRSQVEVTETLTFRGTLSLERNGGFASVRARAPRDAFAEASALKLVLIGDGRTYDFTLARRDVPLMAGSYRVRVATEVGRTEVELPMSQFRPTSFGRPVPGAPALDAGLGEIVEVGVLLADKQPGPFALEVVSMEVVRGEGAPTGDRAASQQRMVRAIEGGVPMFNRGDTRACAALYASALDEALGLGGLTPGERSLVAEALETAPSQRPTDAAWTLRHAMDSVLRSP